MDKEKIYFEQYQEFAGEVDRLAERIGIMHQQHLECRLGCSYCCMDYSLLPVEYYAILEQLRSNTPGINPEATGDDCIFLINNACTIYGFRPVICRTHGLPLLYMNDNDEWELSVCELNFSDFDEEFHSGNTFPQDRFNSRLYMLNKAFVGLPGYSRYSVSDMIPIRNMEQDLA
jgi:uncharacterized protein